MLASIREVGDDEQRMHEFELEEDGFVRVTSIGEGQGGRMYDYGWITDLDSGRRIWEMEYSDTEHAGGGTKNRVVNTVLRLPAGRYMAVYETDGSHSFGDWNTSPPFDPFAWGITVMKVSERDQR